MQFLRALFLSLVVIAPAFAADYVAGPTPLGAYFPGHSLIGVQTFCASGCTTTSTGAYTPDAGTNRVIIEVVAAGGGSGGCGATNSAQGCVGGSAASGSFMSALFTSGYSGVTMTIGAAGLAGTNAGAGGTGGTTSAGSLISCPGGTGGLFGTTGAIAAFGLATNAVAAPSACTNTGGTVLASVAGQGSSSGFQATIAAGGQFPGSGGSTPLGSGPPFTYGVGSATNIGTAGSGYGWGAGGSYNDASQSATVGLPGGPSRIIIYEFN